MKHVRLLSILIGGIAATVPSLRAAIIVKDNNTNALNLGTSWVGGAAPNVSGADSVTWNNTVLAANSTALGGNASWSGITIANPGGLVTITHAAGNALTLGSGGIDLSAATQNLTLFSTANTAGTIAVSANQTWNVAASRALTMFSTSNTATQGLTGSGNLQITTAGGAGTMGVVNLNTGDSTITGYSGNGNSGYSGNWTIGNGGNATGTTAATSVSTGSIANLRHGLNAWGSGSITLNGGQIASVAGNWSWTNAITLNPGTTSNILLASGANRTLKLNGIISSSGGVNFLSNGTAQPLDRGYILTGANTMSGTVTIASGASVRVGGVAETNASVAGTLSFLAGTTGTLGTASVTNNGTLTLSRSDAWTFANNVSGTGVVNIGSSLITNSGTQVVTLGGTNSYTGATTVGAGRLDLTGSLTSAINVQAAGKISGNGSTNGLLTLASGAGLVLAGGASTSGLTANGATFGGANLVTFLAEPIPSTVYNVFTYGAGAVTTPGNLSVGWRGTLSDDVPNQKYIFTAGASGTRTWNTATATWAQGTGANFAEGDQLFYGGDTVIFNEPASASTVTLSGRLAPASVAVNNTTNTYTLSGTDGTADITGASGLTKTNGGTLIITSAQTYTGTTAVNGGIMDIGNGGTTGALGSSAISVTAGAELVFNRSNAFTVSNTISAAGLVTKKGAGRMTVNGNNSGGTVNWNFTGTGNGDIGFQNANAIGATGSSIALQSGATGSAFFATNANTSDVSITLDTASVITWNGSTGFTNTLSGVISGAGAFTKVSGETLQLSGINTYTGDTTISAGTLELAGAGQLGSGNYAGGIALTLGISVLKVNSTASQALSGVLSGAGGLNKDNTGTLTLSGTNTYTGTTTVNAGTLVVSGSLSGSSAVAVNGGTLAGDGPVGAVTLNAGGTVAPGASPASLATGNVTFNGGTFALELNSATAGSGYDQLSVTGGVTLAADSPLTISLGFDPVDDVDFFTIIANDLADTVSGTGLFSFGGNPLSQGDQFTVSGQDFTISYTGGDGNDVVLTAVPEPASVVMLLGGLALLGTRRRRQA